MFVDVQTYGAVGDGTTDDTAAVAAALAAVSGVLHMPAGTYRITAPLTVNPHRVAIRGDGPQSTVITAELQPGQYALTLGWDNNVAPKWGPYDALSGVTLQGTGNGVRMQGTGVNPQAHSMTVRDVGLHGFDIQVDLGDYVYLTRFDRVFFTSPTTYAVRIDGASNSGENISFASCVFSGGPTAVYLNQSGASFYFSHCSFDYCKRAIWQRAGATVFTACHFETGTEHGPGGEFLLLDRDGLTGRPRMSLTDCDFYDGWDNYDTCIRLLGDNGDQGLRVVNPYARLSATSCPYLIRDDGPWPSSVVVSGAWYGRGDFPALKMRRQNGTDLVLMPGITHVV